MFGLEVGFDKPWYLLLLTLLPLLWLFSYRSLSGLGNFRRLMALGLRTLVLLMLVLALAEVQLQRTYNKVTVIYLLDQSESIPLAKRQLMMQYVMREVSEHRRAERRDRAGVIIFGREATIEIPPFDDDIPSVGTIETTLARQDATNLEAAMKLAQAAFPEDSSKRIVVVTDGNENLGSARTVAPLLAEQRIGIDVVPVSLSTRAEVAVEKISLPADIRRGQPMEARVVISNYGEQAEDDPRQGVVPGRLEIYRRIGRQDELLSQQDVQLQPGKNVYRFQHTIEQPAVYTYRAAFTPTDANDDLLPQNNEATAFTHVRGQGRVLLIEDWEHQGDFDFLVNRLRAMDLEVDVQPSNALFTSLAELQGYDTVVLANAPRSSGEDVNNVTTFSDQQIEMLVRNTENFGSGLVMLGGENSFGAGGWANTELEKAMPVDFQIKNAKVQAVGALVLMMHASELAQGNHWQKVVAREAIKTLGPMDYCGLVHWNNFTSRDSWLWGGRQGLIRISGQRNMMLARLDRMAPGDMPQFDPAMGMALASFNSVNASIKHMIVISDGDPSPPAQATVAAYQNAGIKISTVAVGTHGPAGSVTLERLSNATGGKYYAVRDPRALPRIYQREARRVARPLIKDLDNVAPRITTRHDILEGIDEPLPPLTGMVLTTLKDHPLVEASLVSPQPPDPRNATILATWQYGLGRSVAFTSDAGKRWASAWTVWENYDKLFSQMIRWSMRPLNDDNNFTVATDLKDGKVQVVITALDKEDEFLNFLEFGATAVTPDLETFPVEVRQTAPGRYVGEFAADKAGSYFVTMSPGPESPPLLTGVNVPYSAEFRDRDTNLALLKELVRQKPEGGDTGEIIGEDLAASEMDQLLNVDTFRRNLAPAISNQDVWPLAIMLAASVFFADVFIRRVAVSFGWLAPLLGRMRRQVETGEDEQRLERLRSRKAAIASSIDQRRAATRFEPEEDADRSEDASLEELLPGSSNPTRRTPSSAPTMATDASDAQQSYTQRLLKAKQQARNQHPRSRSPDPDQGPSDS